MTMTHTKAPAKLILAGEHSAVQGHPAVVVALNQYTNVNIEPIAFPAIHWQFDDLDYHVTQPFDDLDDLHQRLNQSYHAFTHEHVSADTILQHPGELAQYVLSLFSETVTSQSGIRIRIHSDIPIGVGLGSSSALIMSLIAALDRYYRLQLNPSDYLQLGRQAEHLQHGYSSGVDLLATYHGGCLLVQQQKILERWHDLYPLYMVNTGSAQASTGECVAHTQSLLHHSNTAHDMAKATEQLCSALQQQDLSQIKTSFKTLHRCLAHLGVVPTKVQEFIHALEEQGAAAKVCGAGSITGDNAGIVCIVSDTDPSEYCQPFNYTCTPVALSAYGVSDEPAQ